MISIPNSELEIMLLLREPGRPMTGVEIEGYIGSKRKESQDD